MSVRLSQAFPWDFRGKLSCGYPHDKGVYPLVEVLLSHSIMIRRFHYIKNTVQCKVQQKPRVASKVCHSGHPKKSRANQQIFKTVISSAAFGIHCVSYINLSRNSEFITFFSSSSMLECKIGIVTCFPAYRPLSFLFSVLRILATFAIFLPGLSSPK